VITVHSTVAAAVQRLRGHVDQAVLDGLFDVGENILQAASQVVPIEEGTLLRSGLSVVDPGALEVLVGFGSGAASAYALRQHEDTTYRHDPGRTSHYLSGPAAAQAGNNMAIMAKHLRRAIA
jgi:hypothetical protein